jgi:putative spermidine/putrescine transport system substrate-binding protein
VADGSVYATVLAYDDVKLPDAKPDDDRPTSSTRSQVPRQAHHAARAPSFNLEFALMADGVTKEEVYEVLGTPEGVDRAFAKLDTIKSDVIWWEAGAVPPQLLADGEVSDGLCLGTAGSSTPSRTTSKPFKIVWDGQIYEMEGWVMPKGAPNLEAAKEFIAFSTAPEQQARAAEFISYGPPRKPRPAALVGNIEGTDVPMGPNLPTYRRQPGKLALGSNLDFWVDHDAELQERFNAWLATN